MNKHIVRSLALLAVLPIAACGSSGHSAGATHSTHHASSAADPTPTPLTADGLSCHRLDTALGKIRSTVDILNFGVDEVVKNVSPSSPIYAPAETVDGDLDNIVAQDGSTDTAGMSELMHGLETDEQSLASYCATAGYTMKTDFNRSISTDS